MYKDNLTGAIYSQAEYNEMLPNPVYANLIERLVLENVAPEPTDAKQLNDGNKFVDSAVDKNHGVKPK